MHDNENQSIDDFLGEEGEPIPKLTNDQKMSMETDLTLEELTKYLMTSKNNVAPGSSGFTNEFYKYFWPYLGTLVKKYADHCKKFEIVQRLGVLNLLPKGEKDKKFPITLLNTVYKIISGAISSRIKPFLPLLINYDQKRFVPGRYIGEAIRSTFDIMDLAKHKKNWAYF